ncbi:MAG TPA: R body protein [Roseateles sp.]
MSEVHIHIEDRRSPPPSPCAAGVVEGLLAIAQQGAMASNLAFSNQVRNTDLAVQVQATRQQGMGQLRLAILAKAAGQVQAPSAMQARAAVEAFSGNEAAQTLADLRAAVAGPR